MTLTKGNLGKTEPESQCHLSGPLWLNLINHHGQVKRIQDYVGTRIF